MNNTMLTTKITPILTAICCIILFTIPLGLGNFTTIVAALIVMLASYIEHRKVFLASLGFKNYQARDFFIVAPCVAGVLFLLYFFLLFPSVSYLTGKPIDFSEFAELKGNLPGCLFMLVFIWVSAAFGEEIVWKGYFMRQFIKFFGDGKLSLCINILLFGVLFGWVHAYQGITGQILAGITGMLLAIIFYKRKYNLWFNVAIHGFFDTIAVVWFYIGV